MTERYAHLLAMSDQRGLFEHAEGTEFRVEHGYCTDDNARLLVVTSRDPDVGAAHQLSRMALHFVRGAQDNDGRCRNRMDPTGRWTDAGTVEDCWGRALWGFGVAAHQHGNPAVRRWAQRSFDKSARQRSGWSRAMAFAALGATEVAAVDPHHVGARALLGDFLDRVGPVPTNGWMWPEARLTYGNASLAEAVIAAGEALGRARDVERGLRMLD
ncbi:MAG: glycosyltransferase, partial [Ilumatobacteraceae bacterium]